jgi:hypothetical protein
MASDLFHAFKAAMEILLAIILELLGKAFDCFTNLEVTRLYMDQANRMLRIGFGKHDGKRFFRIDLWSKGYRITKK